MFESRLYREAVFFDFTVEHNLDRNGDILPRTEEEEAERKPQLDL